MGSVSGAKRCSAERMSLSLLVHGVTDTEKGTTTKDWQRQFEEK
jgi:hypothetical protein